MKVECPKCGESWTIESWVPMLQCERCGCAILKSKDAAQAVSERMRKLESMADDPSKAAKLSSQIGRLAVIQGRQAQAVGRLHERITCLNNRMSKLERGVAGRDAEPCERALFPDATQ